MPTETWVELQDVIDAIDATDADVSGPEPDYDKLFGELREDDDFGTGDVEMGPMKSRVKEPVAVDPATGSVDAAKATLMELEEMQDKELFLQRQAIVEKDILSKFDNPSVPSAREQMMMNEAMEGRTLWYDKWLMERTSQYAEVKDLIEEIEQELTTKQMELAKEAVDSAFKRIEMAEITPKDAAVELRQMNDYTRTWLKPEQIKAYEGRSASLGFNTESEAASLLQNQGVQLSDMVSRNVDLTEPLQQLELQGPQINQAALEGLAGDAELVGWDLVPSAMELTGQAVGMAAGMVGGLAVYGLVEGFTPIVKSLVNQYHYPDEHDRIAQATGNASPFGKYPGVWPLRRADCKRYRMVKETHILHLVFRRPRGVD